MTISKKCKSCGYEFKTDMDYLTHSKKWRLCSSGHLWFNCLCNSTLILPKNKHDWYTPEIGLTSEKSKQLFKKLSGKDSLPHIPTHILALQELLLQEKSTSAEIASHARKDPVLSAELITLANNSRKSGQAKIRSIEHAITYVGRKQVADLIIVAALRSISPRTNAFTRERFWKESFLTAEVAEFLRAELDQKYSKDEVFLAAVLANIGKLVGSVCLPDETDQVFVKTSGESMSSWPQAEIDIGASLHTHLGDIGGALWGLPDFVIEAASRHHEVDIVDATIGIHELVGLAIQLGHWANLEPHRIKRNNLEKLFKKFGLTEVMAEKLVGTFTDRKSKAA